MDRLGIDIGGTKVNVGIVGEDGDVKTYRTFASSDYHDPKQLTGKIVNIWQECLRECNSTLENISHIGVGIPGSTDWKQGKVTYSPNLLGTDIPLADYFESICGRRPTIVQDSWAGAFGEYLFGQKKRYDHMLCITLGTGIGCGIIVNGKIFAGAMGTAGEIGHTPIFRDGRACSCGQRGCLEAYASGNSIFRIAKERFPSKFEGRPMNTRTVFTLAKEGDQEMIAVIEECVDRLAYGIAVMTDILSCDHIAVSGGLCEYEDMIIKPLPKLIRQYGYPAWARNREINVFKAQLGGLAPMIGAAFLTEDFIS